MPKEWKALVKEHGPGTVNSAWRSLQAEIHRKERKLAKISRALRVAQRTFKRVGNKRTTKETELDEITILLAATRLNYIQLFATVSTAGDVVRFDDSERHCEARSGMSTPRMFCQ